MSLKTMTGEKIRFKDRIKFNIVFVLLLIIFLGSFTIIGFSPIGETIGDFIYNLW